MRIIAVLLLLVATPVFSQIRSVGGQVLDASTHEPLAFVHVTINQDQAGTTTSINGRFQINSNKTITLLNFSYVGYQKKSVQISPYETELLIQLEPETRVLSEVEFLAGENPALPLIRKVIAGANHNNPNKLDAYYFKSYNKFFLDAEYQKRKQYADNLPDTGNTDSSMIRFNNFLQDKYLFLMESITEKKFKKPDLINEKVLANEISGLQNNTFATLANSFQPFSFYDRELEILGVNFINPVSNPGMKRYFYGLQDSIITAQDTVYIITFEPDNDGEKLLSGLLYINTKDWAIQNVIASYENQEAFSFKIQQQYEQMEGAWFPVQLNTDLIFNNIEMDGFSMKGTGRSYLYDIRVNLPLKSNEFTRMALHFDENAGEKTQGYWETYRKEPMSSRGIRTVTYLDSVSQAIKLDNIVKVVEKLISGYIPIGIIDLPFNRMLRINEVEQFRLGLGMRTNEKLSRYFSLNGYFGYGTRDRGWKYGGGIDLYPLGHQDFTLDFKYSNDLMETGAPQFYQTNFNLFSPESYRNLIVRIMDQVEIYQGGVHFHTMKYFDVYASLSQMQKSPYTNNYRYLPESDATSITDSVGRFYYTIAGLQIKYARTQYYPFLSQKIPVKSNFPVIHLNYYRGFNNLLQGEYAFNKIDFQLSKRFQIGLKNSDFTLRAGYIDQPLPYTEQYFANGSRTNSFSLFINNSFVTMPLNEFLNDRYATLHWRQDLVKLGSEKFYMKIDGHGSAGWGTLGNANEHSVFFRSMEEGYYETGLTVRFPFLVENAEWVLGSFCRLGEYRHDQWQDNLTFVYSLETRF